MTTKDRLTAVDCKNASSDGKKIKKLHDGQGLYLWVYADGKKYWRLRYNVWSRKITILRHPPRHKPEAGKAKRTG